MTNQHIAKRLIASAQMLVLVTTLGLGAIACDPVIDDATNGKYSNPSPEVRLGITQRQCTEDENLIDGYCVHIENQ